MREFLTEKNAPIQWFYLEYIQQATYRSQRFQLSKSIKFNNIAYGIFLILPEQKVA